MAVSGRDVSTEVDSASDDGKVPPVVPDKPAAVTAQSLLSKPRSSTASD